MIESATPTAVYRFYDEADQLLYVGITDEPKQRWRWHQKHSPWWGKGARRVIAWFDDREGAALEEKRAILEEDPIFNKAGRPTTTISRLHAAPVDIGQEMKVADARANFTELISRVRLLRWTVFLYNRRTPMAAVVPIELGELVREVGGADAAIEMLREAQKRRAADGA